MLDDDAPSHSNKEQRWFRIAISVFAFLALISITAVYLVMLGWDIAHRAAWMEAVFEKHAEAVLGLPLAALVALCAVLSLQATSGPIEFEGLGFKFRGASGEIILWVLCMIALSFAIKMLW